MDADTEAFLITHSASPPVDLDIEQKTALLEFTAREPVDLRYAHVGVV